MWHLLQLDASVLCVQCGLIIIKNLKIIIIIIIIIAVAIITITSVGLTYIHTCRPMSTRRAVFHEYHTVVWRRLRWLFTPWTLLPSGRQFVRFWASGGAKFPKMGDSLPKTPMNHCAKFDAASFILGREIRNRTNTQNYKQTVNDITTLCLWACVDNNDSDKTTVRFRDAEMWMYLNAFRQSCTMY